MTGEGNVFKLIDKSVCGTFYNVGRGRATVSIPIHAITKIEVHGERAMAIHYYSPQSKVDTRTGHADLSVEYVRGSSDLIRSYIKFLAMRHGIPIRLKL